MIYNILLLIYFSIFSRIALGLFFVLELFFINKLFKYIVEFPPLLLLQIYKCNTFLTNTITLSEAYL